MACCAFALYLLSQLLLPLRWVRDRLFGAPAAGSAAVGWTPGAALAVAAPRRRRLTPLLGLLLLAEIGGVAAVAATVAAPPAETDFLTVLHSSICSAAKRTLS